MRTVRELGSVTRMEQFLRQATPSMAVENCASEASPSSSPGLSHWPARVLTCPAQSWRSECRDTQDSQLAFIAVLWQALHDLLHCLWRIFRIQASALQPATASEMCRNAGEAALIWGKRCQIAMQIAERSPSKLILRMHAFWLSAITRKPAG